MNVKDFKKTQMEKSKVKKKDCLVKPESGYLSDNTNNDHYKPGVV